MISPARVVVVVFPFDPVIATMVPRQKLRRQFDLADHRLAQSTRLHQRRRVYRHARADHDKVLPAKGALAVSAGFDCNAVVEQHRNLFAELILRLGIGNRNFALRAPCRNKADATPDLPRPTTRTRLLARSIKAASGFWLLGLRSHGFDSWLEASSQKL